MGVGEANLRQRSCAGKHAHVHLHIKPCSQRLTSAKNSLDSHNSKTSGRFRAREKSFETLHDELHLSKLANRLQRACIDAAAQRRICYNVQSYEVDTNASLRWRYCYPRPVPLGDTLCLLNCLTSETAGHPRSRPKVDCWAGWWSGNNEKRTEMLQTAGKMA